MVSVTSLTVQPWWVQIGGEALEVALGRLGDHDLAVSDDDAAADRHVGGGGDALAGPALVVVARGEAGGSLLGADDDGVCARVRRGASPPSSLPQAASSGSPSPMVAAPLRALRRLTALVLRVPLLAFDNVVEGNTTR